MRRCLAILVTLAACRDHSTQRLAALKDEVCACQTASCAEQAMAHVADEARPSTPRTQRLAREMMDCLAKRYAAERPVVDADAPAGATSPGSGAPASGGTP